MFIWFLDSGLRLFLSWIKSQMQGVFVSVALALEPGCSGAGWFPVQGWLIAPASVGPLTLP